MLDNYEQRIVAQMTVNAINDDGHTQEHCLENYVTLCYQEEMGTENMPSATAASLQTPALTARTLFDLPNTSITPNINESITVSNPCFNPVQTPVNIAKSIKKRPTPYNRTKHSM